ncbi:hypothetical protein [Salipiger marinus]|uniref:hypothetical protein n=1 Tax=Salipiger marinus TaxID=555512 RepID=UPI0010421F78
MSSADPETQPKARRRPNKMAHRFSLTEKQVRDLIAMTPPGYVPSVTLAFTRADETAQAGSQSSANPADLIEP